MNVETYNTILGEIKNHKGLTRTCLKVLKDKFSYINEDTLSSILSLEYQKKMKATFVKNEKFVNKYYTSFKAAVDNHEPFGVILRLSIEEDISPCLIAKLILIKHIENKDDENKNNCSLSSIALKYLRDTSLIQDKRLAYEVFLCNLYDDQYSPSVEITKRYVRLNNPIIFQFILKVKKFENLVEEIFCLSSLGQQYEIQLYRQISDLGLAFRDEEYLRKLGYDKTPDVKLEIPIAVDGFIINWIESKALFGDTDVHRDYIKNQYSSYWNRFGTGLVIYWFGYLETISTPNEKRFIIRDRLPENIMTL